MHLGAAKKNINSYSIIIRWWFSSMYVWNHTNHWYWSTSLSLGNWSLLKLKRFCGDRDCLTVKKYFYKRSSFHENVGGGLLSSGWKRTQTLWSSSTIQSPFYLFSWQSRYINLDRAWKTHTILYIVRTETFRFITKSNLKEMW